MSFDVIIAGAGPGGLACAECAARHGLKTLIIERKHLVGKKVCAGGITWNGLLKRVPAHLHEKSFKKQHIYTRYQKTCVSSPTPIIATVNREKLGQYMAHKALKAGAEIRLGCQIVSIQDHSYIIYFDKTKKKMRKERFTYLVGADGSSSTVRRYLRLPVSDAGVGINYQIPGDYPNMEWYLNSHLFASGYSWVFPHRDTISIGAYADKKVLKAGILQKNLLCWAKRKKFSLSASKLNAELINFDFRGFHFDNIFLVGDAAGLASGLTGEGIYSAIVSGETAAHLIHDPHYNYTELAGIIKNHALHKKMVAFTGKNNILATVLFELLIVALKIKLINFSSIEMSR